MLRTFLDDSVALGDTRFKGQGGSQSQHLLPDQFASPTEFATNVPILGRESESTSQLTFHKGLVQNKIRIKCPCHAARTSKQCAAFKHIARPCSSVPELSERFGRLACLPKKKCLGEVDRNGGHQANSSHFFIDTERG